MKRIRKGDEVIVIAGKDNGRRGTVIRVLPDERLIVENINMVKKHQKPNPAQNQPGGIIEKEAPLQISNVAFVHNGERTRVGFRTVEGRVVRWSVKHDEAIDG